MSTKKNKCIKWISNGDGWRLSGIYNSNSSLDKSIMSRMITYGLGGYDPSKPNNNIVEETDLPDEEQE